MGVRVSEEEEDRGLDIAEHGQDLRILNHQTTHNTKKGIITETYNIISHSNEK